MYALVDGNNFYCSCERVFNPALKGRPMIVLSNNDGCAVSRSDEAKALGVEMGTPAFMLKEKIRRHKIAVFSSNYTLYGDMSDRMMQTLGSFCAHLEVYSIDEAYLDLHNRPYDNLAELGLRIRRQVKQHTGLPVTVGIAATKTLAKMANRFAKKQCRDTGVFWAADPELQMAMLKHTPVEDICGIGPAYSLFLKRHGMRTAADLVNAPAEWVRVNLSVVGQRLQQELKGIPSVSLDWETPTKKNITSSRSFGHLLSDKEQIAEALSNYTATCALKLRRQGTCCRDLSVFVHTNPHRTELPQYSRSVTIRLDTPANDTGTLIAMAIKGLNLIFKPGFLYLKAGVVVSDFVPESTVQQNLFTQQVGNRPTLAMEAMDRINSVLGKDLVRMAVQGFDKPYRLRADRLSPRYTTQIAEILKVP